MPTLNNRPSASSLTRERRRVANNALQTLTESMPEVGDPKKVFPFDREQAFLLYAKFCGDVEKTAHSLNISPLVLIEAAKELGWNDKLASIIKLKKSGRPGDIERGINRALNFVQAHRMRVFLERMICRLEAMTDEDFFEYCMQTETTNKDGIVTRTKKLTTRPLADLASALEKVHAITYAALSDTPADRTARKEQHESGEASIQEVHSAIAQAMAQARANTPQGLLLDAQLAKGQEESTPPVTPIERPGVQKQP